MSAVRRKPSAVRTPIWRIPIACAPGRRWTREQPLPHRMRAWSPHTRALQHNRGSGDVTVPANLASRQNAKRRDQRSRTDADRKGRPTLSPPSERMIAPASTTASSPISTAGPALSIKAAYARRRERRCGHLRRWWPSQRPAQRIHPRYLTVSRTQHLPSSRSDCKGVCWFSLRAEVQPPRDARSWPVHPLRIRVAKRTLTSVATLRESARVRKRAFQLSSMSAPTYVLASADQMSAGNNRSTPRP
jgi:hypothetical protein